MNAPQPSEESIFDAAVQLTGEQREAYLDEACHGDSLLRKRVELLLMIHERSGDFMQEPAVPSPLKPERTPTLLPEKAGDRIGRYKLLQQVGEGGCGIVYLAEQEEPVRRQVALKVIKLGMDTKSVIARFEAERHTLALMDHPSIAKVLDAGATQAGRPFFVMEFVKGTKITEFCDTAKLTTAERLKLFIQTCQAIQHAHQKGVIHRDIKPSNVLVTLQDGVPVPKVIDFGIAKATSDQPLTEKTVFTAFEQFIGTPAYMSPEQASFTEGGVDTRSDVYSLGVLLYELLTGLTPFDSARLRQASLDGIRRIIRDEEPATPSTRLGTMEAGHLTETAVRRGTEPARLTRSLRGELDWIVMKALEKDRARRYPTANGLAQDLERYLADEPVLARPASNLYRVRKLVRRNKLAVSAGIAVLTALVLGLAIALWEFAQKSRAEQEQVRLRQQAQAAQGAELELRHRAEERELAARRIAYASDMNLVQQALAVNDLSRAQALLNRQRPEAGKRDLRGWEWRYLWQLCQNDATATFCQPSNAISTLVFSADGNLLATGSTNDVSMWDVPTRSLLYSHKLLNQRASKLAFAPGESLLAFNDSSNLVLWSGISRREIRKLPLEGIPVNLTFTADGRLSVLRFAKKSFITVWDPASGALVTNYPVAIPPSFLNDCFAFSPDGGRFVCTRSDIFRIGSTAPGGEQWTNRAADELLTATAFSPDGRLLATGAGYVESGIKIWDIAGHRLLRTLEGHRSWISYLKFLRDGKTLVSESPDQTIRLWDAERGQLLKTIRCPLEGKGLEGKGVTGKGLDASPDGRFLASSGDHRVLWWELGSASGGSQPCYKLTNDVSSMGMRDRFWSFSSDSKMLLAADGGAARFFDSTTLAPMAGPGLDLTNLDAAALSPDRRLLAVGTTDGRLVAWDMQAKSVITNFLAHEGPALFFGPGFGSGGNTLLTLGGDYLAKAWDTHTWKEILRWKLDPDVRMWTLSPQLDAAATINERTKVEFVPLDKPDHRRFGTGQGEVVCLNFSPDGKLLAAASEKGTLQLLDTESMANVGILRDVLLGLHSVCFSPDGRRVAAGSNGREAVKIWDVESHEPVATLEGDGSMFSFAAFSPDGNCIGARNMKGILHFWRAPSWEEIELREGRR